jgi:hypothetical protein
LFVAAAGYVFPSSADSRILQYTSLAASLRQVDKQTTRGIFLLPNLGGVANASPVYTQAAALSSNIPVYLVVRPDTLQVPAALGMCGLPAFHRIETDYVNFYVIQLTGTVTDETLESGPAAIWLRAVIENETDSKFRVVVFGTPPYSNCTGDITEDADLRWNFSRLGIHMVIATSGCYERFNYDNVTYINVGTGNSTDLESVSGGIAAAGRFELAARESVLDGAFISTAGTVLDRVSHLR